jgi:hypothetical protein
MIDLGRNRERLTAEILTCEISAIVFLQESETSTALLQGLSPWSAAFDPWSARPRVTPWSPTNEFEPHRPRGRKRSRPRPFDAF